MSAATESPAPLLRLNPADDVMVSLLCAIGGGRAAPTRAPPWNVSLSVDGYHAPSSTDGARENVFFNLQWCGGAIYDRVTPAQARELAQALIDAAGLAEDNAARREAYDQIREDFEDADALADGQDSAGGHSACLYGHPDVHYVPEGRLLEALAVLGERRGMVLVTDRAAPT